MTTKTFDLCSDLNTINVFTENCQHYNLKNNACIDCGLLLDGDQQISKECFGNFVPAGKIKRGCREELQKFGFPPEIIDEADKIYREELVEGKTFRQDVRSSIHVTMITEAYYRSGHPMDPRLVAIKIGMRDTKAKSAITIGNENKAKGIFSCSNMVVKDYITCYLSLCSTKVSEEVKEAILVLADNLLRRHRLLTNNNLYTLASGIICHYGHTRNIEELYVNNICKIVHLSPPTITGMKGVIHNLDNNST